MKKIVFFFPWTEVSGGPFYLCRMADALAGTGQYEVYYIDYYNSLSDDILNDFRVRKIPYIGNAREMEVFYDTPVVLITPLNWAHVIPRLHPDSKIIFINWHIQSPFVFKKSWKAPDAVFQNFLKLMADTDSITFMDLSTYMAQNEFGKEYDIRFNERYLPVTVPKQSGMANPELVAEGEINISFLGRLVIDKIYSIVEVVDNLAKLKYKGPINIHVIGSGRDQAVEDILFQRYYPKNINIIRYGTLELSKAIKVIGSKSDILFAMGTSALDGASIGVPTVIVPNSMEPFDCDKYVFLHQSKGYMLGWGPEQIDDFDMPVQSMEQIIKVIYQDGQKAAIGELDRQYCEKNHISNLEQLLSAIDSTKFRFAQLELSLNTAKFENRFVSNIIYRFNSSLKIILGKKIKTYGILGIPIFIKTQRDIGLYNVFLWIIPLLQIKEIKKTREVSLLPLVWVQKAVQKLIGHLKNKDTSLMSVANGLTEYQHKQLRERIEAKLAVHKKIRVCFFEPRIACWQFGKVYDLLEESGIFEPIVVVVPFFTMGDEAMIEYMDNSYAAFLEKGYRTVKGYDKTSGEYLNIKTELDPDVVFYSMYWKNHFQDYSYITHFTDIYTFLYSYGFDTVRYQDRAGYNYELQNRVTRYYMPTKIHKGIAEDNMDNHAKNVYVTGSLKLDYLLDSDREIGSIWRDNGKKKRVIWAPHHTLEEPLPYAQCCAFLDLYDFMLDIAERYRDTVQFAFKPHPMLKPRLYALWGKRKTDMYYDRWKNGENTQFEDGEYFDLFLSSDAMILDSVSFIPEYASTGKPAFFTYGENTRFPVNRFGRAITQYLYRNEDAESLFDDVEAFLDHVVLQGNDEKKIERDWFVKTYMTLREGESAARNVYDDMCRVILEDTCLEYKLTWDELTEEG